MIRDEEEGGFAAFLLMCGLGDSSARGRELFSFLPFHFGPDCFKLRLRMTELFKKGLDSTLIAPPCLKCMRT